MTAAHTLFSIIISQTSTTWISQIQSTGLSAVFLKAQLLKCALQWRKNDLLHKRDGTFVYNWPHPTLEHLFQTYWLIATSFSSRFLHKFRNSPALILTETLIWNEKDRVKYGDFPDQSQSFRILAHSSHRCKLHKAPKPTMSTLDWSGRKPSREPFIWVVCVLCKSYSYKWFHSHFM